MLDSPAGVSFAAQGAAQVMVGHGMPWIEANSPPVTCDSRIQFSLPVKCASKVVVGVSPFGHHRHNLAQAHFGLGKLPGLQMIDPCRDEAIQAGGQISRTAGFNRTPRSWPPTFVHSNKLPCKDRRHCSTQSTSARRIGLANRRRDFSSFDLDYQRFLLASQIVNHCMLSIRFTTYVKPAKQAVAWLHMAFLAVIVG
jgi:hypothetical protein